MPILIFEGTRYERAAGETVLACLTRHGVAVPHSCNSGICQSCLMRAVKSDPPAAAQHGLKDSLRQQRYFLACSCAPDGDLEATLQAPELIHVPARVLSVARLAPRIARVRLGHDQSYSYRPGQFLNLRRGDGLVRSYSIASVPQTDDFIELHVARIVHGRMSNWIHDDLKAGDPLEIGTPRGDCCYQPGNPDQPLLLIGTGCGLAPLYGIIRDALHHGHAGPIWLYHGSRTRDGLYLVDELRELERAHGNFNYVPCVSGIEGASGFVPMRAEAAAAARHPALKNWRVYLCGHPGMVAQAKKKAFLAGAARADILADAFHITTH